MFQNDLCLNQFTSTFVCFEGEIEVSRGDTFTDSETIDRSLCCEFGNLFGDVGLLAACEPEQEPVTEIICSE